MKDIVFSALALAIVIPALFGNFWLVGVTGYIVDAAVVPLLDGFLRSIGPD